MKCKSCKYKVAFDLVKPAEEEAKKYADSIGYTNFDAAYFIAKHDKVGWIDKDGPIRDWKAVIRIWMMSAFRRGEIQGTKESWKDKYGKTQV